VWRQILLISKGGYLFVEGVIVKEGKWQGIEPLADLCVWEGCPWTPLTPKKKLVIELFFKKTYVY